MAARQGEQTCCVIARRERSGGRKKGGARPLRGLSPLVLASRAAFCAHVERRVIVGGIHVAEIAHSGGHDCSTACRHVTAGNADIFWWARSAATLLPNATCNSHSCRQAPNRYFATHIVIQRSAAHSNQWHTHHHASICIIMRGQAWESAAAAHQHPDYVTATH